MKLACMIACPLLLLPPPLLLIIIMPLLLPLRLRLRLRLLLPLLLLAPEQRFPSSSSTGLMYLVNVKNQKGQNAFFMSIFALVKRIHSFSKKAGVTCDQFLTCTTGKPSNSFAVPG